MVTEIIVEDFVNYPKSAEEAVLLNIKYFFTGIPCPKNHLSRRYTLNNLCCECVRIRGRNYNIKNAMKHRESAKAWVRNNREKFRANQKRWREANKDLVRAYNKKCNDKKYHNSFWRASRNIKKRLNEFMNGRKNYRHWEDIVGWKKEDLKDHLENQFGPEMNWSNYGTYWVIDHIIPLAYFTNAPFNEKSYWLKYAWALKNLRPLEKVKNLEKHDKITPDFDIVFCSILDEYKTNFSVEYSSFCKKIGVEKLCGWGFDE